MGPLPAAGGWVRLEVDASAVGLEDKTLNGMAFTLYGGRAYWDKAGKTGFGGPPINNGVYTVDASTNRLTSVNGAPMIYDAAGNQTNDGSGQRTYDAENRMLTAINGGVSGSYTYDTDGRRVRRIIGGLETWQVYGIGGELLAEYAAGGASNTPQKEYGYRNGQMLVVWDGSETGDRQLQWLVQDHLGSTRMVVDRSGSLGGIRRHDFAPFGEELFAGVGIRSVSNGYGGDSVRQKYDGYERDNETGLDYVQARYYGSVQGRFTSPDSFFGRKTNPQTLNLYAYVLNNPLKWVDPTGHLAQKKRNPIDDCHCTVDHIDSEHPGEIEGKKPGFFSKIWGGLKKIGSAIGGTAKEIGSQAARDFIGETKADFRNPSRILDDFNYTMSGLGPNPAELFGAIGAVGAGAGEIGESATVVEDVLAESDVILYHGTDLASAESMLAGEGLNAVSAAALKLEADSPLGFFLATHAEDAAYFAARRGAGTILEFRFSPSAVEALGGLPTRPLGALGKFGRFLGREAVIPAKSFDKFNAIRVSGGITVRPH
jgi:RHS repeat-associated protein